MAETKGKPSTRPVPEVIGRSYARLLRPYLARLHATYSHPNRVLFYDDVVMMYLLAFFNPGVRSLRCIEDASQVPGVNRFLEVDAVRKSTLSDANLLFDPAHLAGLTADLRARLPNTRGGGGEEADLAKLLDSAVLVDGSFFRLAADVAWAIHAANQHGGGKGKAAAPTAAPTDAPTDAPTAASATAPAQAAPKKGKKQKKSATPGKPGIGTIRLNCQFCLRTGAPAGVSVNGSDGVHESAAARPFVEPGHLYLFDSGIVSFAYLTDILTAGSHLLCNLSKAVKFQATRCNLLTDADRAAGVVSDHVGRLPGSNGHHAPPDADLREIILAYVDRNGVTRTLRLLTDLMDLPAHVVAELYRQRWQVELFFRWLKVSASFEHLCSHSRNGVTLAFHVAVIAALLMVLRTGKGLSKYAYNLLGFVAAGQCTAAQMLPILERRERERALARAALARKRAKLAAAQKAA